MREIKETITTEVTKGYEAIDGRIFKSKEECSEYEQSCEAAVFADFKSLWVKGVKPFTEYAMYHMGCEDDYYVLIKVKNNDDLVKLNRYVHYTTKSDKYFVKPSEIGKELIAYIGTYHRKDNRYINELGWFTAISPEDLYKEFKNRVTELITPIP